MRKGFLITATAGICVALLLIPLLQSRRKVSAAVTTRPPTSAACVRCHAEEAAGFARTGMAHAFRQPDARDVQADGAPFFHALSGTWFRQELQDGKLVQRRWQRGIDGAPDNEESLSVDYVMGSGHHARTFLHREQDGSLVELPLAWYSEDGGHWGMNPGFDNTQPMTRRKVAYECMFCHNGYPAIPPSAHRDLSANPVYIGALPEGIDCLRCHGSVAGAAAHIHAAETDAPAAQIRAAILNPARLSAARSMQVCEQCHLETTSQFLPDRIRHYDREPFSYTAEQPLPEFNAYFDQPSGTKASDRFEIASAPYRLRQSQCFLKSGGALTCQTCHDPHDLHKGPEAAGYYAAICMKCHASALTLAVAQQKHPAGNDCVSCHMPMRRTEDVVHVSMIDHLIQRRPLPATVLLAPRSEVSATEANAYHGPVRRYMLDGEKPGATDALYDAAAQVIDGSNPAEGIPALKALLRTQHPAQPGFYIELGDAMRHAGDLTGAIAEYRAALQVNAFSSRANRRLGTALNEAGRSEEARAVFDAQLKREPDNALLWYERSLADSTIKDTAQAIADLRRALALKADFADAQNSLGSALAQSGDTQGAYAAFREALKINPYDATTRANFARLLAARGEWNQAAFQLSRAVALAPAQAETHIDLAVALLQLHQNAGAETEARAAVAADAHSAHAADFLGELLAQENKLDLARAQFEAALRADPTFGSALLDLAQVLILQGDLKSAVPLLQQAERSPQKPVVDAARSMLQEMNPPQ